MNRARAALISIVSLTAFVALASAARADGLPASGFDVGADGVAAASSPFRYVALRAGHDTLLARTAQQGGQVMFSRRIPGRFTIPAVAYDGSASGLSADQQTLVLIRPRAGFPQRRTVIAIVDTPRLRARVVRLHGDFSFDAISPNGRWAYLIHYLSPRNQTRYEVRAFDLEKRRLVPGPIVDPREPGEQMQGIPLTRATSPDGRWAYTLYSGEEPFVHALDTARRTAVCVDLPRPVWRRILAVSAASTRLSVGAGGDQLAVLADAEPVALIDTRSFSVTLPSKVGVAPGGEPGSFPWITLLVLGIAAGATMIGALRLREGRAPSAQPAAPLRPERR
jgi:hypothetical protein